MRLLPITRTPEQLLEACERALHAERIDVVAVTGASNVTGEVWPVADLAELAHRHGAELFVDAAQLAPHRAIEMARRGIDHLAFSGHKLYAPFGSAAILSAEHGIGVRHGCFCAHPLITRLLGVPDAETRRLQAELRAGRRPRLPGAVRASLGLGSTAEDVDRLVAALREIAAHGPRSRYVHDVEHDEYRPAQAGRFAA